MNLLQKKARAVSFVLHHELILNLAFCPLALFLKKIKKNKMLLSSFLSGNQLFFHAENEKV